MNRTEMGKTKVDACLDAQVDFKIYFFQISSKVYLYVYSQQTSMHVNIMHIHNLS